MATNPSSTVVGVFTDRSMAEQVMQASATSRYTIPVLTVRADF
jgi:hypothetical protein